MSSIKRRMARRKMEKFMEGLSEEQKKDLWQPPTFGEKKENEISAYTVAIPCLAVPWENTKEEVEATEKALNYIQTLDGFLGIYPMNPNGTLILFKSENHAKRGRNLIKAEGIQVGSNITEVFIDKRFAR